MYIKRVMLNNVRCFEELEIDFDQPGSSVLFLGDNGDGKSTILKSIAMGLCDESSAAALFRELPGEFVRRKHGRKEAKTGEEAKIEIDLAGDGGWTYRIVTVIKSGETFERVSQFSERKVNKKVSKRVSKRQGLYRFRENEYEELDQDTFPWEQIFVSGYGAGLRVQGTADFQHYLAVDAVYPLFKYDEPLQNPELVVRRLVEAARGIRKDPKEKGKYAEIVLEKVKELLAEFLDLKDRDQVELTPTGIKVKGAWGIAELGELGDGYRATVTWVLDLLAWWFLKATQKARVKVTNLRGILLFDEIEQHLHPRWQRSILSHLKEAFPKVQFIGTTHSPLVASSVGEVLPRTGIDKVIVLNSKDKHGVVKEELDPMMGWRVDKVLASQAFEYQITGQSEELSKILLEASILAGKGEDRTKKENARYEIIKHVVGKVIMPKYQTQVERDIERDLTIRAIQEIKRIEKNILGERRDTNQSTNKSTKKTAKKKKR